MFIAAVRAVLRARAKVDYAVGSCCLPTWNAHQLYAIDQSQWDRALRAPDLGPAGAAGGLQDEDRDYIRPKLVRYR